MAECRNKSSFYTISEGNCLKLWTHTNDWKSSCSFLFDEQPIALDVHPSSWQLAIGFKSGLKIYQCLDKELKLCFEKLGKAALNMAYSEGGNLLACTNAVYIDIIDPVRMEIIMTLYGHKGLVKEVMWTRDSKYLVSCCNNGGVFFWKGNFKETVMRNEDSETLPLASMTDKNYLYLSLAYDDDLDTIIALTSVSTLRLLLNLGQDPVYEYPLDSRATCMCFSKQLGLIAVGFATGKVCLIQWPIIPNGEVFKYEVHLQTGGLTDIRMSYMGRYILVAGDDGNLFILETFRIVDGVEKSWQVEN